MWKESEADTLQAECMSLYDIDDGMDFFSFSSILNFDLYTFETKVDMDALRAKTYNATKLDRKLKVCNTFLM
jgi:hypothetical protein